MNDIVGEERNPAYGFSAAPTFQENSTQSCGTWQPEWNGALLRNRGDRGRVYSCITVPSGTRRRTASTP